MENFDCKCKFIFAIIFQLVTFKKNCIDNAKPLTVGIIIHFGFVPYILINEVIIVNMYSTIAFIIKHALCATHCIKLFTNCPPEGAFPLKTKTTEERFINLLKDTQLPSK